MGVVVRVVVVRHRRALRGASRDTAVTRIGSISCRKANTRETKLVG